MPKLSSGDKIIYEYRKPISESVAFAVSAGTFVFLFGLIIEGARKDKSLFTRFLKRLEEKLINLLTDFWKKPTSWLGKDTEEEDY